MSLVVPESPKEFFTAYLPARFDKVKGALAGKSSSGSMCFRVTGAGEWTFRLNDGELVISDGMSDDVIVQVTVSEADFGKIFVQAAQQQGDELIKPDQQVMAFKALTIDAERAKLVRSVNGTVTFSVNEGGTVRSLSVTPGAAVPKLDAPDCKLECLMSDFMDMQTGKLQPIQLAMSGKLKIIGNAQIPMALSGVFA